MAFSLCFEACLSSPKSISVFMGMHVVRTVGVAGVDQGLVAVDSATVP